MAEFFDPLSFALGVGTSAAIGGGLYAIRDKLPKLGGEEEEEEEGAVRSVVPHQTGTRYARELANFLRYRHMPGKQLPLESVLIEPRLLRGRPPILAIEEDDQGILVETDIYRVLPFLHQFPAIYASFNVETISLKDLESGNPHVAILGIPGSGKSTCLALLGLIALGVVDPEGLREEEETQFDYVEEEQDLPPEIRERRRKEREEVQRRAIEQLRVIQKREEEAQAIEARDLVVEFGALFPIYVHLHDLDLNPQNYGGKIDPAEPLVRASLRYLSKNTAETSPPLIYRMLRDHAALILIDGYDEVMPHQQDIYLEWLAALLEYYGENIIIITGPAVGYDKLVNLGFAPTFVRPFHERHYEKLIRKWVEKWAEIGTLPDQKNLAGLLQDNRNRTIMDVIMKIWGTLQGDIHETGRRGYYEIFVRHEIGDIPNAVEIARDAAAYCLDNGQFPDRAVLEKIARYHFGIPEEETPAEKDDKKKPQKSPKAVKGAGELEKTLRKMAQTALIHELPDGAFAFCHPMLGWYLAGETLQNAPAARLEAVANNPNWHGGLSFATALVDLEPAVLQRVRTPPDLLFSHMFAVVDWMPDAPSGLRWKGEVLKRLGAALMLPNQFPAVREQVVGALVTARDDSGGVTYILRQAVRSGNANIRMLGCIGLGALGAPEAVADLKPMLVDEVAEVQLAAGLALGAIGTEDALRAMTEALLTGDEGLKKAVAESFAAIPGEGHAILRDGIQHEDMAVRRASAFGLARIPAIWALVALYRCMLEDSQWYVRSAAEMAFAHAREPRASGPRLYPEPERYEWLAAWAAERGEAVPEGAGGRQLLMRALQEAPPKIRIEAARALGRLAHVPAVKALYTALADQEAAVRVLAFDALAQISQRLGRPLPGVL